MTLLDKIETAKKLWGILLPHITKPSDSCFGIWCQYDDACIEQAFSRPGRKFHDFVGDPESVHRYTSGTLFNITKRVRAGVVTPVLSSRLEQEVIDWS
jgi:hypothetical protein